MPLPENIRGVLLDVEGTTTPIAFVYETLFPFARERMAATCARVDDDPRIAEALSRLRNERQTDDATAQSLDEAGYALWLMDQDRKSTGLKALQGLIWDRGYRDGTLRGELFDDVPRALHSWREAGVSVRIYSSGSILAQRLLFAHTNHGDLSDWIDGNYDTTSGPKKESRSYTTIATAWELPPETILFLSDSRAELDAAAEAGMRTGMSVRPGNPPSSSGPHLTYADFSDLS